MEADTVNQDDLETELDPRIQIELEKLNSATDEINKLEIELDESNTTFRMLLNESTRRLQALSRKLGNCIERARPYWETLEIASHARAECQKAARAYQRASEVHAAAKETVALAEQRFLSQSEWQFDSAWQEMLNHATLKVTDAELQKAASGREHHQKAKHFTEAEQRVQILEDRLRRNVLKSRPYFQEKQLCQEQLSTQKQRVEELQRHVAKVKHEYSESLKTLEKISEEIHRQREMRRGPREPGVGAEKNSPVDKRPIMGFGPPPVDSEPLSLPDLDTELDKCDIRSIGSASLTTNSERDESETPSELTEDEANDFCRKPRNNTDWPVEGCSEDNWQELNETVAKLNHISLIRECQTSSSKEVVPTSRETFASF